MKKIVVYFLIIFSILITSITASAHVSSLNLGSKTHDYLWIDVHVEFTLSGHLNKGSNVVYQFYTNSDDAACTNFTSTQITNATSGLQKWSSVNALTLTTSGTGTQLKLRLVNMGNGSNDPRGRVAFNIGYNDGTGFTALGSGDHLTFTAINCNVNYFNGLNGCTALTNAKQNYVVAHEMGHLFGLGDQDSINNRIMRGSVANVSVSSPQSFELQAAENIFNENINGVAPASHSCSNYQYINGGSTHYKYCTDCVTYTTPGHTYNSPAATCTTAGACVCGATTAALGHNEAYPWEYYSTIQHKQMCTRCNTCLGYSEHYLSGIVGYASYHIGYCAGCQTYVSQSHSLPCSICEYGGSSSGK